MGHINEYVTNCIRQKKNILKFQGKIYQIKLEEEGT